MEGKAPSFESSELIVILPRPKNSRALHLKLSKSIRFISTLLVKHLRYDFRSRFSRASLHVTRAELRIVVYIHMHQALFSEQSCLDAQILPSTARLQHFLSLQHSQDLLLHCVQYVLPCFNEP